MLRVLLRHWRVSVPGLLLTAVVTVAVWSAWPTTYQSEAQITLIGSQELADGPGGGHNPYIVVGNLVPMASILATSLSSQQAVQQLSTLGVTDSYTVAVPSGAAGPFIAITVTGKDRTAIRQAMPVIIRFAEQELTQLQDDAAADMNTRDLIKAIVIAAPSMPSPVLKGKVEIDASIAIVGLIMVFLLSFAAEGRARRRDRPRRARSHETTHRGHRQPNKADWPEHVSESAYTR